MVSTLLSVLGCFYIILGLALNPWAFSHLFSSDGKLAVHSWIIIILFEILIITFGILHFRKSFKGFVQNINLSIWMVLIITPLLGELLIRTAIGLRIPAFRDPGLYADYYSDDDYWRLYEDWGLDPNWLNDRTIHPLLGWTKDYRDEANPFGLDEEPLQKISSEKPKILFYGDSFVKGASDKQYELPRYINSKMSEVDVIDLGVAGYGLDQIYLMFQQTYSMINPPVKLILLGVLAEDDMDRSILTVRGSQKPYFIIDSSGKLQLQGVPIPDNQREYFQNDSLSFNSFLLAMIKRNFSKNNPQKVELKIKINSKLIEYIKAEAEKTNSKLVFVIFYGQPGMGTTQWQETFLKNKLGEMGLPYIDTKEILLQYAQEAKIEIKELYKQGDGHHNNLGNQVVGSGIVKYLRDNNYIVGN